jgi:hypothetical protein
MTDQNNINYTDSETEWRKKLVIHENNLFLTLAENWQDFIKYGPIDLIEKLFKKHQEHLDFRDYLNNFDATVKQAVTGNLETIMKKIDIKKYIQKKQWEGMSEREKNRHSQKYLEQTLEDFWNEINQAIKTCWLDKNELIKIYAENEEERANVYRQIRPIYIQLRKQGYISYDLTY